MVPLGDGSNTFNVTTTDAFGQSITGQIAPVTYSTNPPQVINTPAQTCHDDNHRPTTTASNARRLSEPALSGSRIRAVWPV